MTRMYSYVVHHDHGNAPNPYDGYCTLANCKYKKKRNNIIELANIGDWIIGTGGSNKNISSGNGTLLYAMKVNDKMSITDYSRDNRFKRRHDNIAKGSVISDRFVLISSQYYYFGRNAIDINTIPTPHLDHPLEKKGPNYRCDFDEKFISAFARWVTRKYKAGMHGSPCADGLCSEIIIRKERC